MSQAPPKITKANPIWGIGRRKTAVARVRLLPGEGQLVINGRSVDEYFKEEKDRQSVLSPLVATKQTQGYDISVNVKGGGPTGQADAVKLGIARALRQADPSLEPILRAGQFLTRDPRMVERKKYGQKGARKRFQFSKRGAKKGPGVFCRNGPSGAPHKSLPDPFWLERLGIRAARFFPRTFRVTGPGRDLTMLGAWAAPRPRGLPALAHH